MIKPPRMSYSKGTSVLGDRLKALRLERGMTLRKLGEKSGLSVGMLSQIENNAADPSLGSLRKLASVFEASIATLFTDPDAPSVHVSRPENRLKLVTSSNEFAFERLTPGRGDLEVLKADIAPGLSSSAHLWGHPSTECAYVMSGELVVEIAGNSYTLTEGQSITFDSRQPHRYLNSSQQPTSIIIAVTPPTP